MAEAVVMLIRNLGFVYNVPPVDQSGKTVNDAGYTALEFQFCLVRVRGRPFRPDFVPDEGMPLGLYLMFLAPFGLIQELLDVCFARLRLVCPPVKPECCIIEEVFEK